MNNQFLEKDMNRALLVSLLKKNIDELILLTQGFSEMTEYPAAIIHLAKNKTDDIRSYIDQLGNIVDNTASTDECISEEKAEPEISISEEVPEEALVSAAEIVPSESTEEDNVEVEVIEEDTYVNIVEDNSAEEEDLTSEIEVIDEEIHTFESSETNADETETETSSVIDLTEEPESVVENIDSTLQETYETPVADITAADKKITIAEKLASQTITRNELHAKNESNGLNGTIAYKKIEDIRQAISLGDRFRFQRELFRNNGEEMNKMLNYINLLASYDEVVSFLQSKYGWSEDHPAANDFYQIIKRKF